MDLFVSEPSHARNLHSIPLNHLFIACKIVSLDGRNQRNIDWRADMPKMEYMRRLEDPVFKRHFRMNRMTFEVGAIAEVLNIC